MDSSLAAIMAQLETIALDCGFSRTGIVDAAGIKVRKEVREACASDKCHVYGKNWSCPPACGSLEACESRIRQYNAGLILQTTGGLEDSFDYDSMSHIEDLHRTHLRVFQEKLERMYSVEDGVNLPLIQPWLLLGSGACKNCPQCTCPQSPCVSPGKMIVSMEAMGILVSELCKANNIPYYYGANTVTFIGCVLVNVV
jgi:predicted metal-binding protein